MARRLTWRFSGLNSFTDGVIICDTKVLITLNLPDGQKTTIEG
ncbi:hypothetical protein NEO07_25625, partial [Escherichia coli]|nr:hypothetical protein [Escherichia coli]